MEPLQLDNQSDIILLFRSLDGRCYGNQFLLVLSTELSLARELSSGDIRQMGQRTVSSAWRSPDAGG